MFKLNPEGFASIWGTEYIIFFSVMLPITIVLLLLGLKFLKTDRQIRNALRITGIVLVILILVERLSYTQDAFAKQLEGVNWTFFFPGSLCATNAFVLSFALMFYKKDNLIIHGCLYTALIGGLAGVFYPVYLLDMPFYTAGILIAGIIHFLYTLVSLFLLLKKEFIPKVDKCYTVPLFYMFFVIYGLFGLTVFKQPKNYMNINEPLVPSLPRFMTSWYMIGIYITILTAVIAITYERVKFGTSFKDLFKKLLRI